MYARTLKRRNADGSETRYVQLAVTERRGPKGTPRAKVIHNFGRENELDRWAIWRLVRSLSRFLPEHQADPGDTTPVTIELTRFECEAWESVCRERIDSIQRSFPRTPQGEDAGPAWGEDVELAAVRRVIGKLRDAV